MNEIFEKALEVAAYAHKRQVDKLGKPYILHPLAVAEKLDDLELKTIAILHDIIEDTSFTGADLIREGIPKEIVLEVLILTKLPSETYEEYIKRVKESPKATAVKLADIAHNTSPERQDGLDDRMKEKYALAKKLLEEEDERE